MRNKFAITAVVFSLILFLTACHGGGGGGGGFWFPAAKKSYTVGGTVSGLAGALELQNNSADDLSLSTNGTFTFAVALSNGAGYGVTIKTRPSNQNCIVTNGIGTIARANVTNVDVTCTNKTWKNPADLTDNISPDGQSADEPRVAMDNNGNAIIVWNQYDTNGIYLQIFKSEYRNGAWTNPANLSDNISPDGQGAWYQQVAMDNNGNAIIVWRQYDGANYQIFKSEYRNGTWTNPANLSDYVSLNGQDSNDPQVAMDNNGNAIIVWSQFDGTHQQIFKSEYRNGVWTHPTGTADNISPDGQDTNSPQVAMDDSGNAIIVWSQIDGTTDQIFKSEYRNGAWTNPASLSDNISPDGQHAYYPQVGMDDSGNAIIVWRQSDGTYQQIFKSEYRSGTWTNPANLSDHISLNGQESSDQQVAMDDNGTAIIVWSQFDGTHQQIFKSEYRNAAWTNPSNLSDNISPDGQSAWQPQVAMDDNGNAVIVWYQSDGTTDQIFKSEYRNGAWTNPTGLSDNISPDGQYTDEQHVAMDNNGNAIIIWREYDGNNDQIFKSEYR